MTEQDLSKYDFEPSPALRRRARAISRQYTIVIEPDGHGQFNALIRELPTTIAGGKTAAEAAHAAEFAAETMVAIQLEAGESPAAPTGREQRSEQVNVRLTPTEKKSLSQESTRRGFRGIADFIRAQIIDAANAQGRPKTAR